MINCNDLVQTHYYRDIKVSAPSPEQQAIEQLQEDVTRIDGDITRINGEISDTNTRIDNFKDRYILFIGDSYASETASYTGGTGATSNWVSHCGYMIHNLKAYYKAAKGGSGFGKEGNLAVSTTLSNWINSEEGQANKDKLTDVVFGFGYNDALSYNNDYAKKITDGIVACNTLLEANMPQAKPWLFSIGWGSNPYMRLNADIVYNKLYPTCEMVKWTYCQAHQIMYVASRFAADRVHPNDDGMLRLGQYISNCLNYGKADYSGETQNATGWSPYQIVNANEIQVLLHNWVVYDGSLITQAKNTSVKITTINNAFTFGCVNTGTASVPEGDFKQLVSFNMHDGAESKHVILAVSLVSVEAGEKYGHMTYDTVLTVDNITNAEISYKKAAPDWGKLSISPYRG